MVNDRLLHTIAANLQALADNLLAIAGDEKENQPEQSEPAASVYALDEAREATLEQIRAVMVTKTQEGKRAEVQELIQSYGVDKLSKVEPSRYLNLLADAEAL